MTLEQILLAIQAHIDRSNEPIDWADEDVVVRIEMANKAIDSWAEDNATEWAELCANETLGVVRAGENSFSIDDDFNYIQELRVGGSKIPEKRPEQALEPGRYFYVTGNKSDGYQVNLGWSVEEENSLIGQQLKIIYFRTPAYLIKPKDIPEMRLPRYIVYAVCAELMIDDDSTQYGKYANDAIFTLANMRQTNDRFSGSVSSDSALDDDNGIGG